MPTKKKQNQNLDSGDEDYRKKRDRNNQVRQTSRLVYILLIYNKKIKILFSGRQKIQI